MSFRFTECSALEMSVFPMIFPSNMFENLSCADWLTIINSHQETATGQACNPPTPHWSCSFSFGGGVLRYPVPKWLLFINYCGEWFFTACAVCSFFSFLYVQRQLLLLQEPMRRQVSTKKLCPHSIITDLMCACHGHGKVSHAGKKWKWSFLVQAKLFVSQNIWPLLNKMGPCTFYLIWHQQL